MSKQNAAFVVVGLALCASGCEDLGLIFNPPAYGAACNSDEDCGDDYVCGEDKLCHTEPPQDAGGDGGATSDGGVEDAGENLDAGLVDGGPNDAGVDAGALDGGSDGGLVDGGALDGGLVDGGPADGGVSDGGTVDGGLVDGGLVDGGTLPPEVFVEVRHVVPPDFGLPEGGGHLSTIGEAVAVSPDGALVAVGAPEAELDGRVFIFARSGDAWVPLATLAPDATVTDGGFGASLAFGPGVLVVGAPYADVTGAVEIFVEGVPGVWTSQSVLWGTTAETFGASVDISSDGKRLLVGAPRYSDIADRAGRAYVFERFGQGWTNPSIRTASPQRATDACGYAVRWSSDARAAFIGCPGYRQSVGGDSLGAVFVHYQDASLVWHNLPAVYGPVTAFEPNMQFGQALAFNGGVLAVGAPGVNDEAGAAYFFDVATAAETPTVSPKDAIEWDPTDYPTSDRFGDSIAFSGDRLMSGLTYDRLLASGEDALVAGAAVSFVYDGAAWVRAQVFQGSQVSVEDVFGYAVASSADGSVLVVGAPFTNDFDGDAYIFELEAP